MRNDKNAMYRKIFGKKRGMLIPVFFVFFLCMSALTFNLPSAVAFDSRGGALGVGYKESVHEDITQEALNGKGFSDTAIELIEDGNTDVDWVEHDVTILPPGVTTNSNYRGEHHFDRNPPTTDAEVCKAGAAYIDQLKNNAKMQLQICTVDGTLEALKALGQALHALQDFFSHSNFVDLSDADKSSALAALNDPSKDPPSSLQFTGFDSSAGGDPPNDPYSHSTKAKDYPTYNAESQAGTDAGGTKFDAAKQAAIDATKDFIDKFRSELLADTGSSDEVNRLWAKFDDQDFIEKTKKKITEIIDEGKAIFEFISTGLASGNVAFFTISLSVTEPVTIDLTSSGLEGRILSNPNSEEQDVVIARVLGVSTGPTTYQPVETVSLVPCQNVTLPLEGYCVDFTKTNPTNGTGFILDEQIDDLLQNAIKSLSQVQYPGSFTQTDIYTLNQIIIWTSQPDNINKTSEDYAQRDYPINEEYVPGIRNVLNESGYNTESIVALSGVAKGDTGVEENEKPSEGVPWMYIAVAAAVGMAAVGAGIYMFGKKK